MHIWQLTDRGKQNRIERHFSMTRSGAYCLLHNLSNITLTWILVSFHAKENVILFYSNVRGDDNLRFIKTFPSWDSYLTEWVPYPTYHTLLNGYRSLLTLLFNSLSLNPTLRTHNNNIVMKQLKSWFVRSSGVLRKTIKTIGRKFRIFDIRPLTYPGN